MNPQSIDMDADMFNPLNVRRMDRPTTTQAASRQKSCNACVRGKRRCDKTMPRCTRCAAKGLDCVYQKLPPMPASSSPSSASTVSMPPPPTATAVHDHQHQHQHQHQHPHQQQECVGMSGDFDMGGFDLSGFEPGVDTTTSGHATGTTTTTSPETLHLDPGLDFSIADLIGNSTSSIWNLPPFTAEPKADFPAPVPMAPLPRDSSSSIDRMQPIRDVSLLKSCPGDECLSVDPLQVYDTRSRIGYVVNMIKDLHVSFSKSRTLPFIHPRLYATHLPRTMMSTFCAASAYANRTNETKAWTLRLLADAVRDVHADGRTVSDASAHPILDKVARVQALCLLDSMRIFDGDISMRHAAEKEQGILKEWLRDLIKVVDELEDGPLPETASRDKPPKTWDDWILLESARRTVIMGMSMFCLVHVLKSEVPEPDMWLEDRSFTASRHLWDASTSVDFFRAWREMPQWNISNCVFRDFWQYARAEDADDFTKLMLTTQVGPDAMDHFMSGETSIPISS